MEHIIVPDPLPPVRPGKRKPRKLTSRQWWKEFDALREYMGDQDAFEAIVERVRLEATR